MRTKSDEEKKEKNSVAPLAHETAADRKRVLKTLLSQINTQAKYTVAAMADDVVSPYFLRRPSGIMQLDIDTGGGLPAGGVSMVSGPDNAGKSYLLYKYYAMHQRLYGNKSMLALAPVEGAPDYWFMRKAGMRIAIPDVMIEERQAERRQRGLPTFTKAERADFKDQIGEIIILAGQTGEHLLDAVHDSVRTNLFGIIGIDSFTALLPEEQAKQSTLEDDGRRASHATLATNFFQRLYPFLLGMWGRNDTTILCTQQVRANNKKSEAPSHIQKYIRDWAPAGSYAARHGKMIDMLVWNGEKVRGKKKSGSEESAPVIGKWINWELMKGKAGAHDNTRGDVEFLYDGFTNDLQDLVMTGIRYKAIVEDEGCLNLVNQNSGEIMSEFAQVPNSDAFIAKMQAGGIDSELTVRREVLAAARIECAYR